MRGKPRVTVNPGANAYTGVDERIIEYSDPALDEGAGYGHPGGLISFRRIDGVLHVTLYRHDPSVVVHVLAANG